MPIVAEQYCPHCLKKVIVEDIKSEGLPLGRIVIYTVEDYKKKYHYKK